MSFIKITTIYSEDYEITSITEQNVVSAREAFDNRVARLVARAQSFKANKDALTIHIDPTEIVDYSQLLEYAETIEAFDAYQPELPQEFLNLMEKP